MKVYVYRFRGKYTGKPKYSYDHPELNDVHSCMLFLAQETDFTEFDKAKTEILNYGFGEHEDLNGGPLQPEVLNTETYKGFTPFYEEAISEGSCLVYYPNT